MIWFVYCEGQWIGTVIAADEDGASKAAAAKFPVDWGILEVVCRRR